MKSIIIILAITFMLCLVTGLCYAQSVGSCSFLRKCVKIYNVWLVTVTTCFILELLCIAYLVTACE